MSEEKRSVGRPGEYSFELCREICEKVADGKNVKKVLKEKEQYPHFATWCRWKNEHKELSDLYTHSMQNKAESMDEAIDDVMLMVRQGEIEHAAGRVLIDTLKWKAAKYYPKMFGENKQIEITETLLSEGERLARISELKAKMGLIEE